MALKDFLTLADDKLAEAFEYVAPDKSKHRTPFLRGLDQVKTQYEEGKPRGGNSAQWSANNNVVRFTPKLVGKPVAIGGKTEFHYPSGRFGDALADLRKAVEAGELDDALHEAFEGMVREQEKRDGGKPRDPSIGSVRAGWSKERREKFEASVAARRAAKDGK